LSKEDWSAVEDRESVLVDPVCLAFDVSPDRHSSIVASGRNEQGHMAVELIDARPGTGWLAERLVALYRSHEVAEFVCDGFGPAAAIARKVDEAGIKVRLLDSGDYGKACGQFVDAVGEQTIRHLGQDELNAAIRGAKARQLVDRWAWSRTKSTVNISPLVAATLALYSAIENDVGTVEIF
jgi:glucose-6-phosphate dehydrogenase assembly protein OpcA